MSGNLAITPIPQVNHQTVDKIQGCANPQAELHLSHKERGLEKPPHTLSYSQMSYVTGAVHNRLQRNC
jgi:hypothetical protein